MSCLVIQLPNSLNHQGPFEGLIDVCLLYIIKWVATFELFTYIIESQTEISAIEQELKRAQDNKQEIERKIKLIEEEKTALEKVSYV